MITIINRKKSNRSKNDSCINNNSANKSNRFSKQTKQSARLMLSPRPSYLEFMSQKASGTLLTTAEWLRKQVTSHPAYKVGGMVLLLLLFLIILYLYVYVILIIIIL